jgi:hypothetical protein
MLLANLLRISSWTAGPKTGGPRAACGERGRKAQMFAMMRAGASEESQKTRSLSLQVGPGLLPPDDAGQ